MYWLGRRKAHIGIRSALLPETVHLLGRVIFVLEGALYNCSRYKSLVDKSVADFFEANFNRCVLDVAVEGLPGNVSKGNTLQQQQ